MARRNLLSLHHNDNNYDINDENNDDYDSISLIWSPVSLDRVKMTPLAL